MTTLMTGVTGILGSVLGKKMAEEDEVYFLVRGGGR